MLAPMESSNFIDNGMIQSAYWPIADIVHDMESGGLHKRKRPYNDDKTDQYILQYLQETANSAFRFAYDRLVELDTQGASESNIPFNQSGLEYPIENRYSDSIWCGFLEIPGNWLNWNHIKDDGRLRPAMRFALCHCLAQTFSNLGMSVDMYELGPYGDLGLTVRWQ